MGLLSKIKSFAVFAWRNLIILETQQDWNFTYEGNTVNEKAATGEPQWASGKYDLFIHYDFFHFFLECPANRKIDKCLYSYIGRWGSRFKDKKRLGDGWMFVDILYK